MDLGNTDAQLIKSPAQKLVKSRPTQLNSGTLIWSTPFSKENIYTKMNNLIGPNAKKDAMSTHKDAGVMAIKTGVRVILSSEWALAEKEEPDPPGNLCNQSSL